MASFICPLFDFLLRQEVDMLIARMERREPDAWP